MEDLQADEDKQVLKRAKEQIIGQANSHVSTHIACTSTFITSETDSIVIDFGPVLKEIGNLGEQFLYLKSAVDYYSSDLEFFTSSSLASITHVSSSYPINQSANSSSHSQSVSFETPGKVLKSKSATDPKSPQDNPTSSALSLATISNQPLSQTILIPTTNVAANVSPASSSSSISSCSSSKKRKSSSEIRSEMSTTPPKKARKRYYQNEGVTYKQHRGRILQSNIVPGLKVFALHTNEIWSRATVTKVISGATNDNWSYEVKFRANGVCKMRSCHQLACLDTFRLFSKENPIFYGARVACRFNNNRLYSAIIAEESSESNQYRILIFFDDGYAMYAKPSDVFLVFGLQKNPWMLVKNYLTSTFMREFLNIKTLHLLKLKKGEILKVEYDGEYLDAEVIDVDCRLALFKYLVDSSTEYVYRGSKRLKKLQMILSKRECAKKRSISLAENPNLESLRVYYKRHISDEDDDNEPCGNQLALPENAPSGVVEAIPEKVSSDLVDASSEKASSDLVDASSEKASSDLVDALSENASSDLVEASSENASSDLVEASSEKASSDLVDACSENASSDLVEASSDLVEASSEKASSDLVDACSENASSDLVDALQENPFSDLIDALHENPFSDLDIVNGSRDDQCSSYESIEECDLATEGTEYKMMISKGWKICKTKSIALRESDRNMDNIPLRKPHSCGTDCLIYSNQTINLHGMNPLIKPMSCNWARLVTKTQLLKFTKHQVYYLTPCKTRCRNMFEVNWYLNATGCRQLFIDNFCFDPLVRTYLMVPVQTADAKYFKADYTDGLETVPISCINELTSELPPEIKYHRKCITDTGVNIIKEPEFLACCTCTNGCQDPVTCECQMRNLHVPKRNMKPMKHNPYLYRRLEFFDHLGIYECNKNCSCDNRCHNRVVQNGIQSRLQLFKTNKKGWGVRCLDDLASGTFICNYTGRIQTESIADKKGQEFGDEYFAVLDHIEVAEQEKMDKERAESGFESGPDAEKEPLNFSDAEHSTTDTCSDAETSISHLRIPIKTGKKKKRRKKRKKIVKPEPSVSDKKEKVKLTEEHSSRRFFNEEESYIIDAKYEGNLGRYFNHSCAPNLLVKNIFIDTHDVRFPTVSFFTSELVKAGTELTWDYNYEPGSVTGRTIKCFCGASNCRRKLL